MPLSFDQIQRGLRDAKARGLFQDINSVQEFAQLANQATRSNEFAAGDVGFFGKLGVFGDRVISGIAETSGIQEAGRRAGQFTGDVLFDNPELGSQVGEEVGRTALSLVPALFGPAGMTMTGLLTAGQVSAQTGDPVRSLTAGALAGALPVTIGAGQKLLTAGARATSNKLIGTGATQAIGNTLSRNALLGIPARTVPAVGAGFGADVGADIVDIGLAEERTIAELGSKEYWQGMVIGNIAFLPLDIQQAVIEQRRSRPSAAGQRHAETQAVQSYRTTERLDLPSETKQEVIQPPERQIDLEGDFDSFFDTAAVEELALRETFGRTASANDPVINEGLEIFGGKVRDKPVSEFPLALRRPEITGEIKRRFAEFRRDHLNKVPQTKEDFVIQLQEVNALRRGLGVREAYDSEVAAEVNKRVSQGDDLGEAQKKTLQRIKNELDSLEKNLGKVRPDDQRLVALARGILSDRPEVLKQFESSLKSVQRDDQLVDDMVGILTKPGLSDEEAVKSIKRAVDNARTRRVSSGEERQKPGPKPREIDLNEIERRVNELDKKTIGEVRRMQRDFDERLFDYSEVDNVQKFYKTLQGWLDSGKPAKDLERQLFGNKGVLKNAIRDAIKLRGETVGEDQARLLKDRAVHDEWEENGLDAMLLQRAVTADNEFILGLERVIKIDKDSGQFFIGNEKFPISKKGRIPENRFKKLLGKKGVSQAVWEAFKRYGDEVQFPLLDSDGNVIVENIVRLLETDEFIKTEVHGTSKREFTTRMSSEIAYDLEAYNIEIDFGFGFEVDAATFRHPNGDVFIIDGDGRDVETNQQVVQDQRALDLLEELSLVEQVQSHPTDFAAQFGDIAPDEFQPFNPQTGLGNTAVEVRVGGLQAPNHVLVPETLVWVRGKFIDRDGKRVYRIDEVQSDGAQKHAKRLRIIKEGAIRMLGNTSAEFSRKGQTIRAHDIPLDVKGEEAIREFATKHAELEHGHPLYPDAENIGLRAAISHAIKNGVEAIFTPDSNSAMLTERHDRAARRGPVPGEYQHNELIDHSVLEVVGGELVETSKLTGKVKVVDSQAGTSIFFEVRDRNGGSIRDVSKTEFIGNRRIEEVISKLPERVHQPTQAPGMRAAYDERIPNALAKLTEDRGTPADLGRHKESPLVPGISLIGTAPERLVASLHGGKIELREDGWGDVIGPDRISTGSLTPGEVQLLGVRDGDTYTKAHTERLKTEEVLKQDRPPVLFTPTGEPHTNTTGRLYPLDKAAANYTKHGGIPLVGREAGFESFTTEQQAASILRRKGFTPEFADAFAPEVVRLGKVFEQLTGEQLEVGTLVDNSGQVAGLSSRSAVQRSIFVNPNLRGKASIFALLHEGFGHQVQKAYELNQLSPFDREVHERFVKAITDSDKTELATFMDSLAKSVLDDTTYNTVADALRQTANNPSEAIANLAALAAWDSFNGADFYRLVSFMPQPIATWVVRAARFVRDLFDGMRAWLDYRRLTGQVDEGLWKSFRENEKVFRERIRKVIDQDFKDKERFSRMGLVMPGEVGRYRSDAAVDGSGLTFRGNTAMQLAADAMLLPGTKEGKKALKNFAEFFGSMLHRAERFPSLKMSAAAARRESDLSHIIHRQSLAVLYTKRTESGALKVDHLGEPVIDKNGPVDRVFKDARTHTALNDLLREQNIQDKGFADLKRDDPGKYEEIMNGLDASQRALVEEVTVRFREATAYVQEEIIQTLHEKGHLSLARWMRDKMEGTNEEVLGSAKALYDNYRVGVRAGDLTEFGTRAGSLGLNANNLVRFLDPYLKNVNKQEEFYRSHQHWVSEQRWERYHVAWKEKGETLSGRRGFRTEEEAIAFVHEQKAKGLEVLYPGAGFKDMHADGRVAETIALDQIRDFAAQKTFVTEINGLRDSGAISPEAAKDITDSVGDFTAALEAAGVQQDLTSLGIHRRFSPGRDSLDMGLQHMIWLGKVSRSIPRVTTEATFRLDNVNPAVVDNPEAVRMFEQIRKGVGNFRKQDSPIGQNLLKLAFGHYMAFNISTGLIEAGSWPLWLSPQLTEEGASLIDSYTLPVKAANAVAKHRITGKWDSGGVKVNGRDAWGVLLERMSAARRRGRGRASEFFETAWQTQEDLGRMAQGYEPMGKKLVTRPVGTLIDIGAKFYSGFVSVNSDIGFISAFELKRKQLFRNKKELSSKEFEQLVEESNRIVQVVNNDIGRIGRPVGLFSGWRTTGMALYSLQSFNTAQIMNFHRRFVKGFGLDQTGEQFTKKETAQARKAFAQGFISMVAAAGVLGAIPFADSIMALLEEHTDLEAERSIREFFASLVNDPEMSTWMADMATHGMMYASGVPFDLSGRLAMSGMAGFNNFEGWSLKSFLGPVVSQHADYIQGAENILKGDMTKAIEKSLPVGFRNLYKAVREEGTINNTAGRPIYKPTDSERIGMAIGIRPSEVTSRRDMDRLLMKNEQVVRDQNMRVVKEAARTSRERGPMAGGNVLREYAQDNPGYNLQAGYDALIGFLNQEEFGEDYRRRGSVQTSLEAREIAKTFRPRATGASELQLKLAQFQKSIALGDFPGDPGRSLESAILVDLLQNQTGLSFPAARFLAAELTAPAPETFPTVQELLQVSP